VTIHAKAALLPEGWQHDVRLEIADGRFAAVQPDRPADPGDDGAVAGLCPITEADLGDGIFPAPAFVAAGGRFGIGSDCNVAIGVGDELRQLEYSQRLSHGSRNMLARVGGSTGRALFDAAHAGGVAALCGGVRGIVRGGVARILCRWISAARPILPARRSRRLDFRACCHRRLHLDRRHQACRGRSACEAPAD
jgi:cytosine/adenosine deaminase-related metal-dependent hydrolase